MPIRPWEFKKEVRKLQIEVGIKDKKTGQIDKLTHEEEIELKYTIHSTTFDVGRRYFSGSGRKKIIQIDKDGKKYSLLLEGEVKKGWFKDKSLISIKPTSNDFEIISQKVVLPQWRARGFVAIGVAFLLLVGGIVGFVFWRKSKKKLAK